jgi:hypothetical protein
MLIVLRHTLRRRRRHLLILAAIAATSLTVVLAHGAFTGADHMGQETAICLAVLESGLAAASLVLSRSRLPPRHTLVHLPGRVLALGVALIAPAPRARASPSCLQVFRQ